MRRRDQILDFLKVKDFSYDCERVFSRERWLLTGEAGRFADPLYSPGSNFIAYSNCFITEIVTKDLGGEDAGGLVDFFEFLHATLFDAVVTLYRNQYRPAVRPRQDDRHRLFRPGCADHEQTRFADRVQTLLRE